MTLLFSSLLGPLLLLLLFVLADDVLQEVVDACELRARLRRVVLGNAGQNGARLGPEKRPK